MGNTFDKGVNRMNGYGQMAWAEGGVPDDGPIKAKGGWALPKFLHDRIGAVRASYCVAVLLGSAVVVAQPSPYNGLPLVPPDSVGNYRLIISGHFHGASSSASGYPAATLLARIDAINALQANALLSTGDLFLNPDRDSARFAEALFQRLTVPLYNAPGNHDREGNAFGGTAFPFILQLGRDRIILLDTERDNSDIRGDQLAALEAAAKDSETGALGRVFIITHRPVWAEADPTYGPLFHGNTRSLSGCNYEKDVWPLVQRMATRSAVVWASGSMAGGAPASVFFQPHVKNVTFIQSAIRDELRDALLVADVSEGDISWSLVSLTGQPTMPVEELTATWWKQHRARGTPEFNWRLLPYFITSTVTHRAFGWGAGAMVFLLLLLRRLLRRWW